MGNGEITQPCMALCIYVTGNSRLELSKNEGLEDQAIDTNEVGETLWVGVEVGSRER